MFPWLWTPLFVLVLTGPGPGPPVPCSVFQQNVRGEANLSGWFSGQQFSDSISELSLTPWSWRIQLCISVPAAKTQPCMIRCLWYRNTPSPAQEVCVRVSTASQPGPSPGRVDKLSQTFMSWYVLTLPKIIQDKYYFNSLHIWQGVACPDLILHKYQNKESDNYQNKESDSYLSLSLWSSPPLNNSPIEQIYIVLYIYIYIFLLWDIYHLKYLTHIVVNSDKSKI